MLVDHLFRYRISPWPKTAEKRGFCTGVTDGPTDGRTDRRTDRPSYRNAFLTDASKNGRQFRKAQKKRRNKLQHRVYRKSRLKMAFAQSWKFLGKGTPAKAKRNLITIFKPVSKFKDSSIPAWNRYTLSTS